ncbi:lysis system i-spanin subunit Rz [Pseudomonas sp. NFACC05-1]|uniref:lysis system i-spanin subunit Rz n=1 Tax=Pseudomonas sp. NFACC05-1 TaxID=1566241 RepID=UPI00087128BB|nr:lysis system i-spanin subunit Rz [Pseudomonas sp. NFACC05-1]SCW91819.1 prophage endopeptidase [Pseudomonas sp. NFACC05-1]
MGAITRYLIAGLVVALILAGWRLDHVSTRLSTATERVSTLEAAAESRRNTQKILRQLDTENTKVLTNAQASNKALLARLGSGGQRLSVPARCPVVRASTSPGSVDDAEARTELDPAHGQRIVAITNDGDEAIIALNALIDHVNASCLPRK